MNDHEDPYDDVVRAAYRLADWTYGRLARKVIHAMRRFGATGIFDEGSHRTLWDEYCHERHHGPHADLESVWDQTITPYIDHALASLSHHERDLINRLNDVDGDRTTSDRVRSEVDKCAMDRDFPPRSWLSAHG
jgi:hypothetical protein